MKRRNFLGTSAAATAALLTSIIGCSEKRERFSTDTHYVTDNKKLAGLTLEELRQQYRNYLFDDFLPFMEKYVIDFEYGGFMCNTDRDGTNITKNKTTWYEGRGIWVYSFLYNKISGEQKFLDIARKSVEFILKNEPKGDNFYVKEFTREGKPIGDPVKDIYGDLFVACGLSEYSKATGEKKYWEKAKNIILKCISIYDRPDYPGYVTYGPKILPGKGERVLGHWMILMNLSTQMLEQEHDSEIEKIAARCVDAIMNYHFNKEYQLLNEVLTHDMTLPNNDYSRFAYIGHAMETLWMVMYEAQRLKDKKLFNLAAERFMRHVEVAWDDVYGGVFHGLNDVDNYVWQVEKVLWAQEEVLVGALLLLEHTGSQWAKDWFCKMYNYVIDKYPLKQYGYQLWINSADRKITFEKHYNRVENFHHPRHLMFTMLAIDRMIQREEKVSDLFNLNNS